MRSEFSGQREAIIDRADRAIEGRFDLLGFENLSFGNPPDWLLEPVSGKRAPFDHWSVIDYLNPAVTGDKKITWELNRHQHFVTLGQAYWLTQDEKYAEAFVAQADIVDGCEPAEIGDQLGEQPRARVSIDFMAVGAASVCRIAATDIRIRASAA